MARLMYGTVNSDGLRIQYYRTGEEKPVLIFLHGAMDNGLCWNNLPLFLEPEYDVVLVDARGHGISAAPESGYSSEEQAKDIAVLIQELKLYQPVLIGHSMGADTAAAVAAKFPGLVKGLVLEDPPWPYEVFGKTAEERASRAAEMLVQITTYKAMSFDELLAYGKEKHPMWDDSEYFQWAKARQLVNPKMVSNITEPRGEWRQIVSQIKCSGLLVTGDPDLGAIITSEVADGVSGLWKRVEIVNIPGAGHSIRREKYREFRDVVKKYLRKIKRG